MSSASTGFFERAQALALRLDLRRVAAANGAIIVVLGVLGVLHIKSLPAVRRLRPQRGAECARPPTLRRSGCRACIVALLLGKAEQGTCCADLARAVRPLRVRRRRRVRPDPRASRARHGIDWQILYSPLGLSRRSSGCSSAAASESWEQGSGSSLRGRSVASRHRCSRHVEYGDNNRRVAAFNELVVCEELLEMAAVVLIGLALLAALRIVCSQTQA